MSVELHSTLPILRPLLSGLEFKMSHSGAWCTLCIVPSAFHLFMHDLSNILTTFNVWVDISFADTLPGPSVLPLGLLALH